MYKKNSNSKKIKRKNNNKKVEVIFLEVLVTSIKNYKIYFKNKQKKV